MTQQATGPEPAEPAGESQPERIAAVVNYLRWFAAEEAPFNHGFEFNADKSLEWFCQTLPHRPLLEALKGRYAHVRQIDNELAVFPIEKILQEKVLIPLHQAKVAFILGHELGCIALSGMVAEMLAIFRFRVSPLGSGPHALTEGRQKRLFGRSFEEIEHSRRVGILELAGLVDSQTADEFMALSRTRNKYLHRLSQSHEEMAADAVRAYGLAVKLAVKVLGLGIKESRVTISPQVLAYIRQQSPFEEAVETREEQSNATPRPAPG